MMSLKTFYAKEGFNMNRFVASLCSAGLVFLSAASLSLAANYDFKDITPEIEKALKSRQSRYYQLQKLKQEGVIGENNKGYVTDLKNNATATSMADAENRDRRVLYENLAEQNHLGGTGLLEIQKAFAEVQAEKAGAGDMVQSADGHWKKKS